MKRLIRLCLLTTFGAWVVGVSPGSSASSRGFHQELEAPLVEIQLVVEDESGQPVTALQAEDFEIFLAGAPVLVQSLSAPTVHSREDVSWPKVDARPEDGLLPVDAVLPEDARLPVEAGPKHLVVCMDQRFLEPGDLSALLQPLGNYVSARAEAGDLVSLFSIQSGLALLQPPTTEADLLLESLKGLQGRPGGSPLASEQRAILQEIARAELGSRDDLGRDQDALVGNLLSRVKAFEAEVEGEIQAVADSLELLVPTVGGLPGNRSILYIGGRAPTPLARSLDAAWQRAFGRNSRWAVERAETELVPLSDSAEGASSGVPSAVLFQRAAKIAESLGVPIHTLDVGSLVRSAMGDNLQRQVSAVRVGNSGPAQTEAGGGLAPEMALVRLAEISGGKFLVTGGSLEEAFDSLPVLAGERYSLRFAPPERVLTGRSEALDLEIRFQPPRPGLQLQYRRQIRLRDRDQEAVDRTVSALLLQIPDNSLEVVVELGEGRSLRGGLVRVPVSVRMPLANLALLGEGKSHVGRISLFATSGGLNAGVQPVHKAVLPVEISNRDLLTAMGRDVEYKMEIAVDSKGSFAIGVRDDFAPSLATVVLPMNPEYSASGRGKKKKKKRGERP